MVFLVSAACLWTTGCGTAFDSLAPNEGLQDTCPLFVVAEIQTAQLLAEEDSYTAPQLSLRQWLAAFSGAVALATIPSAWAESDTYEGERKSKLHAEFPSHDPSTVRDVVAASHVRIDRVRELVEASPALAKAAWDWGFGDWESALGAASHRNRVIGENV